MALLAVALLASAWGCHHNDRNDKTRTSEKQDRIDVTRGTPPKY